MEMIVVTAPDRGARRGFYAAAVLDINGVAFRAAPIIKYMKGWPKQKIISYCRSRQWMWEVVASKPRVITLEADALVDSATEDANIPPEA